jgi:hypothetical protein
MISFNQDAVHTLPASPSTKSHDKDIPHPGHTNRTFIKIHYQDIPKRKRITRSPLNQNTLSTHLSKRHFTSDTLPPPEVTPKQKHVNRTACNLHMYVLPEYEVCSGGNQYTLRLRYITRTTLNQDILAGHPSTKTHYILRQSNQDILQDTPQLRHIASIRLMQKTLPGHPPTKAYYQDTSQPRYITRTPSTIGGQFAN